MQLDNEMQQVRVGFSNRVHNFTRKSSKVWWLGRMHVGPKNLQNLSSGRFLLSFVIDMGDEDIKIPME